MSFGEPVEIPDPSAQVRLALATVIPLALIIIFTSLLVAFVIKRRRHQRQQDGSDEPLLPRGEDPTTVRYAIDLPCLRGRQCLGGRLCLNRHRSLTPPASPELPRNEVNGNENLDV